MGKKLDALFGRHFKSSKFKALVNVAVSRLSVLKNQRRSRCSLARSDVVELLNLAHHDRALLRVEQVIKEQNMLDVFVMIEGYFHLLVERINLIEREKVCPEELKEAVSSLLFASTRCGEFPELQEMRTILTSQFGKEFAGCAIELRNNCGVNLKMVQKLSTRQPSLENRMKVLKEIASENNIVLQIEETSSEATEVEKSNITEAETMEATLEHAKNLESNEQSWINSELNAKLKEKMTETRKQWKVEGRPLKMIVGTGLPLMYSHGTMIRIVAIVKEITKMDSNMVALIGGNRYRGGLVFRGLVVVVQR